MAKYTYISENLLCLCYSFAGPHSFLLQTLQPITALLSLPAVIHWAEQAALLLKEDLSRVYLHTQLVNPEAAPRPPATHTNERTN